MAVVDELLYLVGFEVDPKSLSKVNASLQSLNSFGATVAKAIGAATLAVGGFVRYSEQLAGQTEQMKLFADNIGIGVKALQELNEVAVKNSLSTETLNMSLKKMVKNVSDAARGEGEAADTFKAMGINVKELARLAPEDQLNMISDAMSGMANQGDKVSAAMSIFGRGGADMLNIIGKGSAELMKQRAQAIGVLTEAQMENALAFDDAMDNMTAATGGLAKVIATDLMPFMSEIVNGFTEWVITNKDLIKTDVASFIRILVGYLRQAVDVLRWLWNALSKVVDALGGLESVLRLLGLAAMIFGFMKLNTVFMDMITVISSLKFSLKGLMMGAGLGLLLLALDDIVAWVNGNDSIIGLILGDFDTWWASFQGGYEALKNDFFAWVDAMIGGWNAIEETVSGLWTKALDTFTEYKNKVMSFFNSLANNPIARALIGAVVGSAAGPVGTLAGAAYGYFSATAATAAPVASPVGNQPAGYGVMPMPTVTQHNDVKIDVSGVQNPMDAANIVKNSMNREMYSASQSLGVASR